MKTLKIVVVSLALGSAMLVALTRGSSAQQDFPTPDGTLNATLAPQLPPITRALLDWRDAEATDVLTADELRAKATTESIEWVQRVLQPELVPSGLIVKSAAIMALHEGTPTLYDATRAKFTVRGGTVFVIQTAGFMCVAYKPDVGSTGAASSSPADLRRYLEEKVGLLFQHSQAMLYLSTVQPITDGLALGPDMRRYFPTDERLKEEIHALDPKLPYPTIGGFHSYYWGSQLFCTNGLDVIATFNKVQGGAVFAIDRARW